MQRGGAIIALCSIATGLSAEVTAVASTTAARNEQDFHQAQSDYLVALQGMNEGQHTNLTDLLSTINSPTTGDSPTSIPHISAPATMYPTLNLDTNSSHGESQSVPPANADPAPKLPKFNLMQPDTQTPASKPVPEATPPIPHFTLLAPSEVQSETVPSGGSSETATQPAAPTPAVEAAPQESSVAPDPATVLPTGDTMTLAKAVLNNPNISFQVPAEKVAFRHIADTGHAVECGAPAISPKIPGLLLKLADKYKIVVGVLTDDHACDNLEHPKGRAVDINGINPLDGSAGGTGNYIADTANDYAKPLVRQFYKDTGEILAANGGGALAQFPCFNDSKGELKVGGVFYYTDDLCNHVHIDFGTSFAARAEPRINTAPQPVAPTPPPPAPKLPATAGSNPRKYPNLNLVPAVVDPSGPDPKPTPPAPMPHLVLAPPEVSSNPIEATPQVPSSQIAPPSSEANTAPNTPAVGGSNEAPPAPAAPSAPAAGGSNEAQAPTQISVETAIKMLPGAKAETVRKVYPMLMAALKEFGIDDYQMERYVFATISTETGSCLPIMEIGSESYLKSRDYYPYVGRGYIQLTWLGNYQKAGKALGLDLENHPDLAMDPQNAVRILAWFMTTDDHLQRIRASLNKGDLEGARIVVNGKRADGHPNGMTEFTRGWNAG
jgi:predicted chitinase